MVQKNCFLNRKWKVFILNLLIPEINVMFHNLIFIISERTGLIKNLIRYKKLAYIVKKSSKSKNFNIFLTKVKPFTNDRSYEGDID